MLNVHVITVGKLGQSWLREGCGEYLKRLGAFCKIQVTELEEYRLPDSPSPAQVEAGIAAEGERILAKLPSGCFVAALCIEGEQLDSVALARRMQELPVYGPSNVAFVIGGSGGLSPAVKNRADLRLSFSRMTFPHQMARLMLLEQLYRAFSINNGNKYHK